MGIRLASRKAYKSDASVAGLRSQFLMVSGRSHPARFPAPLPLCPLDFCSSAQRLGGWRSTRPLQPLLFVSLVARLEHHLSPPPTNPSPPEIAFTCTYLDIPSASSTHPANIKPTLTSSHPAHIPPAKPFDSHCHLCPARALCVPTLHPCLSNVFTLPTLFALRFSKPPSLELLHNVPTRLRRSAR